MKQRNKATFMENIREIFKLFFQGKIKELMFRETENTLLQFFRYCFVGAVATIIDWAVTYSIEKVGVHYLIAATLAFVIALTANYFLSKSMVFNGQETHMSRGKEFLAYAGIGVLGLLMTLALMYVMTEWFNIYFMISKIVATFLVLLWNYGARRFFIYS